MTPDQAATLFQAIRFALDSGASDVAAGLAYLGQRMWESPTAELWARIEYHAELVAA